MQSETKQADDSLSEARIDGEQVFDGRLLKVYRDRVRLPDGSESWREFVRHPGACVIVAEIKPRVLIFERQFRYPVGRSFIELPAGKLDAQETLLACAQRELLEETGYSGGEWQHLGAMHPCIGYSNERIEIFFARNLNRGMQRLDEGEFLELVEMSLDDAEAAVFDGRITDAKTITALFWARHILK
ncbi:MAG TPA: NUDIX hydrolase [Rhodocyclaceae bacterium]|nr:NUDIX hydrolase [Rhodocyclaceae bacterium]